MNAQPSHTSIHAHALSLGYSPKRVVLRDASLSVTQGEIVGLVGANGAGKTTLFRALIGDLLPLSGSLTLSTSSQPDLDLTRLGLSQRARRGIGYLPQQPALLWDLSALQNLQAALHSPAAQRAELSASTTDLDEIIKLFSLSPFLHSRADRLSGGQTRRLELARLALMRPALLLCDEPFNGLDPEATHTLSEHFKTLSAQYNTGILITDHRVHVLHALCSRFVTVQHHTTTPHLPQTYLDLVAPQNNNHHPNLHPTK